jgi:hypothetical protein
MVLNIQSKEQSSKHAKAKEKIRHKRAPARMHYQFIVDFFVLFRARGGWLVQKRFRFRCVAGRPDGTYFPRTARVGSHAKYRPCL